MSKSTTPDAFALMKTPFAMFDPADAAAAGTRNADFAARAAHACFSGAAQMNWEMFAFMSRRVRKDIACAQSMMTAGSGQTAYETQTTFVQEAIRDYVDQASKMFELATDIANSAIAPAQARASEVIEEVDEIVEEADKAA
ncbi:MAG: TIGR01841 family phasin [Oricola sp.]|nr:TIGR01841 family phasin [Oricola sp.]